MIPGESSWNNKMRYYYDNQLFVVQNECFFSSGTGWNVVMADVRSAIFYIAVEHPLQKNLHSSSTQSNLLIIPAMLVRPPRFKTFQAPISRKISRKTSRKTFSLARARRHSDKLYESRCQNLASKVPTQRATVTSYDHYPFAKTRQAFTSTLFRARSLRCCAQTRSNSPNYSWQ